jgi:hypothetical protein
MPIDPAKFIPPEQPRNNFCVKIDPRVVDGLKKVRHSTGRLQRAWVEETLYAALVKDGLIEPFAGTPEC